MVLKTKSKIAIARVASGAFRFCRRLVGKGDDVIVTRRGIRWQLDLREGIDFAIYIRGSFEPGLVRSIERHVSPGDTVLDIGANIGANTLFLASQVGPHGRVIAFEPTDYGMQKLKRNINLNPDFIDRVSIQRLALTSREGQKVPNRFYARWPLTRTKGINERHMGELVDAYDVPGRTLDGFLRDGGIDRVDFIKLDVDGYELEVLAGARETLAHHRPVVSLELAPYVFEQGQGSFKQLLEIFFGLGYRLHSVPDHTLLPAEPEKIESMIAFGAGITVLALPK